VPVQGASALAEMPDGALLAVGRNGVHRLQVPLRTQPARNP